MGLKIEATTSQFFIRALALILTKKGEPLATKIRINKAIDRLKKMNRLIAFVFLSIFLMQCEAIREPPEFLRIEKVNISEFRGKTANLSGDAIFYNPNRRGMTLKEVNIDVRTGDRLIGKINKIMHLKIKPESTFKVPLDASVNIGDIGVLNGLLSILSGNEIEVNYSGEIKVLIYGVSRKLYIDHSEKLQF